MGYLPLLEPQQVQESALERLMGRLFGGSPEQLLTHLVSGRKLSEAELRRVKQLVDEQLEEEP